MFIPAGDDDVSILIDNSFDFFHVSCFDIVFLDENKLLSIPVKLCHAVITLDMDVNRLMLFVIKEERKAKKTKNFRLNNDSL